MLGGDIVHASLLLSASMRRDLSLAFFVIHLQTTSKGQCIENSVNLSNAMPCQMVSEKVTKLCLKH